MTGLVIAVLMVAWQLHRIANAMESARKDAAIDAAIAAGGGE